MRLLDGTIKFLLVTYVQSWKWDVRFQSKKHFSYRRIAWAVWSKKNKWVMSSGVTVSLKKTTKPFSSWGILFFLRVPIKTFWLLIFVSITKAFPEYVIKTYLKRSLSCMPFQRKSFLFLIKHEGNCTRADLDGKYQKRERSVKVRKKKRKHEMITPTINLQWLH